MLAAFHDRGFHAVDLLIFVYIVSVVDVLVQFHRQSVTVVRSDDTRGQNGHTIHGQALLLGFYLVPYSYYTKIGTQLARCLFAHVGQ